jgi:hypothetical protein
MDQRLIVKNVSHISEMFVQTSGSEVVKTVSHISDMFVYTNGSDGVKNCRKTIDMQRFLLLYLIFITQLQIDLRSNF